MSLIFIFKWIFRLVFFWAIPLGNQRNCRLMKTVSAPWMIYIYEKSIVMNVRFSPLRQLYVTKWNGMIEWFFLRYWNEIARHCYNTGQYRSRIGNWFFNLCSLRRNWIKNTKRYCDAKVSSTSAIIQLTCIKEFRHRPWTTVSSSLCHFYGFWVLGRKVAPHLLLRLPRFL